MAGRQLLITLAFLAVGGLAYAPSSLRARGSLALAARAYRGVLMGLPATYNEDDPEYEEKAAKALKAMVFFANSYCKNTNTAYCQDPSIPAYVLKGLAEHKVTLGAPLCPCRHYEDKQAEAKDGYWNCPCVPMRERHECHCMLFLTPDNEFAGESQQITVEETIELTEAMGSINA